MSGQHVAVALLWQLIALLHTCPSHALNLDDLSPTIVQSGVAGSEEVGFGWSVAQHRFSDNTYV